MRRQLDPVQAMLIPAHVTLCREDELARLPDPHASLAGATALTLQFGPPVRFEAHGILLPCMAGQAAFDALRRQVLGRSDIRHQAAHLTLAHPRNPKSLGNRLPVDALASGLVLTLSDLRWIRQVGDQPWQTLARQQLSLAAVATATRT